MDEIIANTPELIAEIMQAIENGGAIPVASFARLTGTSETSVRGAWETGRLPSERGGKIPVREGIVALVSCGGLRKGKVPGYLLKADEAARERLGFPPRDDCADAGVSETAVWRLKYLKAQTAARLASAQAKQMENDVAKGKLVSAAEVELDASITATSVAGVLMRIPERAAGMCVGCSADEVADILRKEISLAFEIIQMSAFTGDWKS